MERKVTLLRPYPVPLIFDLNHNHLAPNLNRNPNPNLNPTPNLFWDP